MQSLKRFNPLLTATRAIPLDFNQLIANELITVVVLRFGRWERFTIYHSHSEIIVRNGFQLEFPEIEMNADK